MDFPVWEIMDKTKRSNSETYLPTHSPTHPTHPFFYPPILTFRPDDSNPFGNHHQLNGLWNLISRFKLFIQTGRSWRQPGVQRSPVAAYRHCTPCQDARALHERTSCAVPHRCSQPPSQSVTPSEAGKRCVVVQTASLAHAVGCWCCWCSWQEVRSRCTAR